MATKAAVVIGVDKPGPFPRLQSAAAGAQSVAAWLEGEGYDVKCLTDKVGPVDSRDVEKAIVSFVTVPPRYSLLVVYFSGHGLWHARSDRWLLSDAPVTTSAAINLGGAMDVARYSGIPNVVFISDACRSLPDARSGAKVDGVDGFPNYPDILTVSKVDFFKATSETLAAYEGNIDGKPQSLLTRALLTAFEAPEPYMVREIVEGAETIRVVPNRRLEKYLQDKVDSLLFDIDPGATQTIEANVPSSEDVYIARVRGPTPSGAIAPGPADRLAAPQVALDPGRDAATALERSLGTRNFGGGGAATALRTKNPLTEIALEGRLPDPGISHFETQAGFVVRGGALRAAHATNAAQSVRTELLHGGDGLNSPGIVRMYANTTATVVLEMVDGRGAVVPCLPGYIGHVTMDDAGMANVSFVPSSNHGRWSDNAATHAEMNRLRALVAVAVEHNTFTLRSKRDANEFAQRIRMLKGVDPTLGLYAAHAFSQAGNDEEIASVLSFMRDDLHADLFDVRMLASRSPPAVPLPVPLVPFCPMLTQSWNLLRPRGIVLPDVLQQASAYLCDSLWTTFESPGAALIIDAIKTGALP